jgi:hypothetical protein
MSAIGAKRAFPAAKPPSHYLAAGDFGPQRPLILPIDLGKLLRDKRPNRAALIVASYSLKPEIVD